MVATVAVLFLLPVFIAVAIAIRLDSPGPVLFRQRRYGLGGHPVLITKFRTMRHELTDTGGRQQATRGDMRVTRIGRFLRSTCLDEIPQFVDVMFGRLALVGPRPHPIEMEIGGEKAERVIENYHARHLVRPGITGLAQINGNRGPLVDVAMGQERIDYDIAYIRKCNFWLDLQILLATLTIPFRKGGSY